MEVKVSVIVPVYNVELYLEECLDSIINQTYKDIEIILINDGSTDRSTEIIKSYSLKDKRIIVVNQPNGGLSTARNAGIEKASGNYLLFVDSDDSLLLNSIEVLYDKTSEICAEIVIGNALLYYPDGSHHVYYSPDKELYNGLLWTGESTFMKLMEQNTIPFTQLFFIQRDIVIRHELFFQKGILHEDELWCVKAILSTQKVLFIDFNFYLYRQRENSIMNSDNKGFRVKSLFEVAKLLNEFTGVLQKRCTSTEVIACVYTRIFWICHYICYLVFQNKVAAFSHFDYFSELLIKVYPDLSYSQQRYCLNKLRISMVFNNLDYETSANLTVYE